MPRPPASAGTAGGTLLARRGPGHSPAARHPVSAPGRHFLSLHHSLTAPPPGVPLYSAPAKSVFQPEPNSWVLPSPLQPSSPNARVPEPCTSLQQVWMLQSQTPYSRQEQAQAPLCLPEHGGMTEKPCYGATTSKPCSAYSSPALQWGACRGTAPCSWQRPRQAPGAGRGRQVRGRRQGMSGACPALGLALFFLLLFGKAMRNPNITINAESILSLSRGHGCTRHRGGDPGTRCKGAHSQNRPGREGMGLAGSQPAGETPGRYRQTDRQTRTELPSCQPSQCCSLRRAGWHQAA